MHGAMHISLSYDTCCHVHLVSPGASYPIPLSMNKTIPTTEPTVSRDPLQKEDQILAHV